MNNLADATRPSAGTPRPSSSTRRRWRSGRPSSAPTTPTRFESMNNLAVSYEALGRHAEALKLGEETLALRKAKLGPDHPDTLLSMYNLANFYEALGRHADALKLYEETLALRKAKLGPDHPDTLVSMAAWPHAWSRSIAAPRRCRSSTNVSNGRPVRMSFRICFRG